MNVCILYWRSGTFNMESSHWLDHPLVYRYLMDDPKIFVVILLINSPLHRICESQVKLNYCKLL